MGGSTSTSSEPKGCVPSEAVQLQHAILRGAMCPPRIYATGLCSSVYSRTICKSFRALAISAFRDRSVHCDTFSVNHRRTLLEYSRVSCEADSFLPDVTVSVAETGRQGC